MIKRSVQNAFLVVNYFRMSTLQIVRVKKIVCEALSIDLSNNVCLLAQFWPKCWMYTILKIVLIDN